jgi:hypothetical protein
MASNTTITSNYTPAHENPPSWIGSLSWSSTQFLFRKDGLSSAGHTNYSFTAAHNVPDGWHAHCPFQDHFLVLCHITSQIPCWTLHGAHQAWQSPSGVSSPVHSPAFKGLHVGEQVVTRPLQVEQAAPVVTRPLQVEQAAPVVTRPL